MAAVRAVPSVLNGDVDVHIAAGTYKEEIVLSRRQRNGQYVVRLVNDSNDPAQVRIEPPDLPNWGIGILVLDEIVEIQALTIDGFGDGGIDAFGGGFLTLAHCTVSNNGEGGVIANAGHLVELVGGCSIQSNEAGLVSSNGTIEVDPPFSSCGNDVAAEASHGNIHFEFDSPGACAFCIGDGPMLSSRFSYIEGYGPCSNDSCLEQLDGQCSP
jgi:hypothetical protein